MTSVLTLPDSEHPVLERLGVEFDPRSGTLDCGGRSCHLAPREAAVFAAFLRAEPGAVISRDDLLETVWGNGDVCEDALTVIISRLRRHLHCLGVDETVIETVPRRGYRLVERDDGHFGPRDARRDGRLQRWLVVVALGVSLLALSVSLLTLARLSG